MPFRLLATPAGDGERPDARRLKEETDLRRLLAPGRPIRGDRPVMMRCDLNPGHEDTTPSLAVWAEHLHCFGCGLHLDLFGAAALVLRLPPTTTWYDLFEATARWAGAPTARRAADPEPAPAAPIDLPALWARKLARYHEYLDRKRPDGTTPRAYLRARGLSDATIADRQYGWDGRAFVIPVWGPDRALLAPRFRRDDAMRATGPKYWGLPGRNAVMLYNAWQLGHPDFDQRRVVLCEGELDADVVSQLVLPETGKRVPAVALTNGVRAFVKGAALLKGLSGYAHPVVLFDATGGDPEKGEDAPTLARRAAAAIGEHAAVVRWAGRFAADRRGPAGPLDVRGAKDPSELLAFPEGETVLWLLLDEARPPVAVERAYEDVAGRPPFYWHERDERRQQGPPPLTGPLSALAQARRYPEPPPPPRPRGRRP
jgi:hypothetical protein